MIFLLSGCAFSQSYDHSTDSSSPAFPWPEGKRCALSLTFDDARFSQADKGIPLLNRYGIKATFYISPHRTEERLDVWMQAIERGHEIGNHSMTHPCTGNYSFSSDNALEEYDLGKIAQDIDDATRYISEQFNINPKSFAYPCGQKFVGRGKNTKSYVPLVAQRFLTGRGWLNEDSNDPWLCDGAQLLAMESDGKSFEQLKLLLDKAAKEGRWLILAGHEMDEQGRQTTHLLTLESLCRYISEPENGIWVETVSTIYEFILEQRANHPKGGGKK